MSPSALTESDLAETPALEQLQLAGWTIVRGADIAPGTPTAERDAWRDVVLLRRLAARVAELNPQLPTSAVADVVAASVRTDSPNLLDDHAAQHAFLCGGLRVSYRDAAGDEHYDVARLVDFDHWDRNEFWAVSQFTVQYGQRRKRPDVLLFVNGIPLVQLEFKNPSAGGLDPDAAINQIHTYRDIIPSLYRHIEIVCASDYVTCRVGTITSSAEHFAVWKDPAKPEGDTRLAFDVALHGAFTPERLLLLIRDYVAFQDLGATTVKVLAKYHQVDAVERALVATREAMGKGGRAGVVWHTQGSGKSLTMAFYASKVRRDPLMRNPTLVFVTDRIDLDDQLHGTFAGQRGLADAVVRADSVADGPSSLRALLDRQSGGVIFTTIQKFQPTGDELAMPVVSERDNVIVIADEAHRSQYQSYAQNLVAALPNATRIGFTGTPIERADRSTRTAFGDYISVYSITDAIADQATVPIYYESRRVPIEVTDHELLGQVDHALAADDSDANRTLATKWGQLAAVVGAPDRLLKVADDIAAHFAERQQAVEGKALVVTMTRSIAGQLATLLKDRLGADAVTAVMSTSAQDSADIKGPRSEYHRAKAEMEGVARRFKDPDDPLKVVVVRDMWLTGFDAPACHTLYVDKPMRDHGLLQAIARVNRVFKGKAGGLVVDYIGIGDDLRASLSAYDQQIADDAMIPLDVAKQRLVQKHEVLTSILNEAGWKLWPGWTDADATKHQRITLLDDVADALLEDTGADEGGGDRAVRFRREQALFKRWFGIVSPNEPAPELADDASFFAGVSAWIARVDRDGGEASKNAEQLIKQLYSEGLASAGVVPVTDLAGDALPELSVLSDEFLDQLGQRTDHDNLRRRLLEKLLNDEISMRGQKNHAQATKFSERLDALLARYEQRQLSSQQVIEALIELAKELRAERHRHEALGLAEDEVAFYDALIGVQEAGGVDDTVRDIVRQLVPAMKAYMTVDWATRENVQAAVRAKVKRLLRKYRLKIPQLTRAAAGGGGGGGGATPLTVDQLCGIILQQARALYVDWPGV